MKLRLTVHANDAEDMSERTYVYQLELSDKTPLDQVEAHAKTMFDVLAEQANTDWSDDDDEGDGWKKEKAK